MTTPVSTGSPTQQPSPALALLSALVLGVLALFLFSLAEAGPVANIMMPVFPFVIGGLGLAAAKYALRTWRAVSASDQGSGARRSAQLALTLLALLVDVALIGFALLIGILMVVGTGIS